MNNKTTITFSVITIIIGFMLATLFLINKEPIVRDTRDIWEIREDLKKEQELQRSLLNEIDQADALLEDYEDSTRDSKQAALRKQKEELEKKIGLTEVKGEGVVLKVEPLFSELLVGETYKSIPPQLLSRLINDLNRYGAEAIAVGNERIISTTPIRSVNQMTYVNNSPLPPLPLEIKIFSANPQKLYNHMLVSQVNDDFAIENLGITLSLKEKLTLPPYDIPLRIKYLEPVEAANQEKVKG
jgi:uncharacterized protein YlxW (UPF0749 family)